MASLDRPKLRPLPARWIEHWGQTYAELQDPLGAFTDPVRIPIARYLWVVRHFDGRTALSDIQARATREADQGISPAELERLVAQLDRAMVLDGPTFAAFHAAYRQERVRPPAHAGRSYLGTERALRAQLGQFFAHEKGAGLPRDGVANPAERLRGILSPHIDFYRGGPAYTWSYKELIERSDADTFVILGVAHHHCRHRFALTRKDFETPLGQAPTDRSYVDRVAALAGTHLFDDELAHRPEHSIEFQVVFLQYLLGGRRAFSIVPILVGSFNDLMQAGIDPIEAPEVRRFVEALRAAESASGKRVAYIGAIDLSHVGPEFGDPEPLDRATLDAVRGFDAAMLDRAAGGDPAGWFGTAADVGNRWRVCGLAATYTMLHAMGPAQGRLLWYDQAVTRSVPAASASPASPSTRSTPTGPEPPPRLRSAAVPETPAAVETPGAPPRPPCPAPADFRAAVAEYDRNARVDVWGGPRYRMTYRVLGQGPPLILSPGIASTYRGYALTLNKLAPRFRTILYDYPGEHPDDGARLARITHDDLVDDVFGLIAHLNIGRAFLVGLSFGATIALRALHREPRRFPKAVVQGAFARRRFTPAERLALRFGRRLPGTTARLPLRETILSYNNQGQFPAILADRWTFYLEQNGLTPIAPLAGRLDLVARLDLRPILPQIPGEVLLLQGNEDRIVARTYYEELLAALPRAQGIIMPLVGHLPHFTHAEALAQVIGDWLLPCTPGGCPNEPKP